MNNMEIFNELMFLLLHYCMIPLTDFVDSPEDKYTIGWWMVGITGIQILTNIFVAFGGIFIEVFA